eukprot:5263908-Pyramimonas_sp.AAC.1
MAARPRLLDIREPQIVVNFPLDALPWHHRVLLLAMGDGRWMCLAPDMEITQHNLNELRHYVLDRNAQFPRWVLAGLYAFDPIDPGELLELKRQARQRAVLLGAGDPEDEADLGWVVAEPQDARFGEVVPEDV